MWNLKYGTNEPNVQNRNRITDRENRFVSSMQKRHESKMDWEFGLVVTRHYI